MDGATKTKERVSRISWTDVAIVVFIALAVRALYLFATADVVFVRQPVGDAASYFAWAQRIAAGEWVGTEPFYQAPAYPYLLALLFKIFGVGVASVRIAQCVGTAIAAGMLTILATWVFERRVGFVAGVMLALYAPTLFFDGIIQKASLSCALTCAVMLLIVLVGRKMSVWSLLLLGALSALLSLTRENALVWIALLIAWVMLRSGRCVADGGILDIANPRSLGQGRLLCSETPLSSPLAKGGKRGVRRYMISDIAVKPAARGAGRVMLVGAYVFGVSLVLFPVAARNAWTGGEWSISTFQAGTNFYIGNHAGATGRYVPLVRGHETPAFERTDATVLAERAEGEKLSARQVSQFWFGRALKDIRANPGQWIRLLGRKLVMVVNDYEVADAESAIVYADGSWVLRGLEKVLRFGVLCPLAALGIVLTWRRWRELWIFYALALSMVCAVAVFYVMARYRYPLVPLLILFAAAGVVETARRVRARAWRRCAWSWSPVIVVVVVAVVCWWPIYDRGRLDALAWMNAGVAHAQLGELEPATHFFRRAVSEHPGSAEAQNNLAQALAMTEKFGESIEHYKAALLLEPGLVGANYNFGVALEQLGRRDEALDQYRKAIEVDPADTDARAAVERIQNNGSKR